MPFAELGTEGLSRLGGKFCNSVGDILLERPTRVSGEDDTWCSPDLL